MNPLEVRTRLRLPPLKMLTGALVIGLAVVVLVCVIAHQRPWLGLKFSAAKGGKGAVVMASEGPGRGVPVGTVVMKIGSGQEEMEIEALDLTIEPDGVIGDYATYRSFLQRQGRLAAIQGAGEIFLTDAEGKVFRVTPDREGRPLSTLPPDFWVGLGVGLIAWLVSAAVFAFRPREASARYLLLSGMATLIFAPGAAVYTTRELAMDGTLFRWASDLNFFGGSLFAASFVALLLVYPRRLAPAWVGMGVVGLYVIWFVMQQVDVFESKIFARRFLVMVGVLTTFVLAGVHWFGTRRDPVGRAALQWFLLSWVLGTGMFAMFFLLPQTFGVDTTPMQGYAFLLFLLVYGGLAFGILRYRLFELGEWWRRVMVWVCSALILVALDLFFMFGLHLSTGVSLTLALVICGLIWLPFRTWVWERLVGKKERQLGDLFGEVMNIALAPQGGGEKWKGLLRRVFDPLGMEEEKMRRTGVAIERDGLALCLPGMGGNPALRLEYARGGRSLFTRKDAALAGELVTMLRHGIESRNAYEKGVAEERGRIARDVHDNIGAQLLGALHSGDAPSKDAKIREAIADLREFINHSTAKHLSLDETLAELRVETAERLAVAGVDLEWTSGGDEGGHLAAPVIHALRSIIREAVTNIIRHAEASRVGVSVVLKEGWVSLKVVDDGKGFEEHGLQRGRGILNMRERTERLGGTLVWENGKTGTSLVVRIQILRG